ncbi:F-box protein CPR1 isoform X5 [Gossypium hirsutum]|uniref:F-box protein CPR1 isoform X5 n=1 Tax=Gossypium hirsutum TaxID=3635 RepID=A0ABM2ZYW1_GOSHI|nr:F-box protein CPR1-like isoform X5 [Gossypium hirsutum]
MEVIGDLPRELFLEILLRLPAESLMRCKSLLVWNDCIALVIYPERGIEKSFEIFVMKEYGVKESWTNVLTIGPLTRVERPLVFRKNDEILMEGSHGQMMSYNLRNKEVKDLPIYGVPKSFSTLVYVNSLVSVKGGNQMLDQRDNTGESDEW